MKTRQDYIDYIRRKVPPDDLICQIAEEASELAHAALKLKRAKSGTNPTPVSVKKAFANLCEEAGDVLNALQVYDTSMVLIFDNDTDKLKRWAERLGMTE